MAKPGFFITFEGPDGSGKSTQFKRLVNHLKHLDYPVVVTREPGGHPLSEKIRSLLLLSKTMAPTKETELLLFLAARAQHVADVIRPALKQGKIVMCERFSDSTYAYQVAGRQLSSRFYQQANRFATQGLKPNLTILLDIKPELGLRRAYQAKQGHDRMETESLTFVRRVRKGYLTLAKQEPRRMVTIQADQPLDIVTQLIRATVEKRLTCAFVKNRSN